MQSLRLYTFLRLSLAISLSLLVAACGFQLRGVTQLSFKNLYIQGSPVSITKELKQSFKTNGIHLVDSVEAADVLLEILSESNEKRILSLSGAGVVSEYELNYKVNFRTRDPANPTWDAVQTVQTRRDFSFNDSALLGKAEEETALNNDMRKDAVREMLRRLTAIKPAAK